MIEYLYKDNIHYLFLRHCFIKEFHISSSDETGCYLFIVYYSFVDKKDCAFTYYIDDDIEDLHSICIRRVSDEISHRI